jgi:hypothetical protein
MLADLHPAAVELTTDEARSGRDEREWELVADPEAARRAIVDLLAGKLPARERRIRAGYRRTYAAYGRGDWEINTLLMHPTKYVFEPGLGARLPDARDTYVGVEEYLEVQQLLLDAWPELRLELVDVLAIDDDSVTTLARFEGQAARSGLELGWMIIARNRFEDGLTVSQKFWFDVEAGAAELGVPLPRVRR